VFEAADGPLVITVGYNAQFRRFCTAVLGRPDLAEDERFATNLQRSRNRAELLPQIGAELLRHRRADLLARLRAEGIPAGEVLGLHAALTSQRAAAAGMVIAAADAEGAGSEAGAPPRFVLAPPYRLDGRRVPVRRLPPPLAR